MSCQFHNKSVPPQLASHRDRLPDDIALYELLGDASMMNTEFQKYQAITIDSIHDYANKIFANNNSNTLLYHAQS